MFFLRLVIIAFIISYLLWFVNNKIFNKNTAFSKIISISLLITLIVYFLLTALSHLLEQ